MSETSDVDDSGFPPMPPMEGSDATDNIWKWARRQAIVRMNISWGARECWRILDGFPAGQCYPSHYWIAETLHKSDSAVRRYLNELKNTGYIGITARFDNEVKKSGGYGPRRKKRPRGQTSNCYAVLDQEDLIACAREILQEWSAKHHKSQGYLA